ncbi:MAG: glycosyltransferase [Planctomycetaceae bacterium]
MSDERPVIGQLLHGLTVGGAEVLASRLARRLQDRFRFVFFCLDELGELGAALQADGFTVHLLGRTPGIHMRCMRRLARLIRGEGVQIVHAHQYTPFFYSLAARVFGCRAPVLFTEHGRWHPDCPRRKRIVFNRLFLRRCDRVVGVGEAVRRALIDNEGIAAERVEVIYNGIGLDEFQRADAGSRGVVRREIGMADEDFMIIQVARLDHLKDHQTAIRALERVVAVSGTARLVLVGDGPERGRITAEIEQRGLQGAVRLLGLRQDVPRLLAAADLCLLTSISEGIPLTLIEAMAAELPVVATDVGGVREVVEASETALLAASGDDAEIAAAVLRLQADETRRRRMGARGRRRAWNLFSESQMHAAYAALYDEMFNSSHAPSRTRVATA